MKNIYEYKSEWEYYISNVDDKIGSVVVDLGIKEIAPVKDYLNVMYITLTMNNPREDGLSSNEESTKLSKIGDKVVN